MAKKPTHSYQPNPQKKPVFTKLPTDDSQTISWRFSKVDRAGSWKCSLSLLSEAKTKDIIRRLHAFDSQTWASIKGARHHTIEVHKICKEAQDRLVQIKRDDEDTLFSIAISGKERLWGIREGNVFNVLWWDPEHKVYPSVKKHT